MQSDSAHISGYPQSKSTSYCLKMSKQRDTGKSRRWYYSRCFLESPRILYLVNANKLLGETWEFFNVSNSVLSKSWYGTSSTSLAAVDLAVRLGMSLGQMWSLELIWLCCRSRRDMTVLQRAEEMRMPQPIVLDPDTPDGSAPIAALQLKRRHWNQGEATLGRSSGWGAAAPWGPVWKEELWDTSLLLAQLRLK